MKVLVIHDLGKEDEVMVYELADDEERALEQAKRMFDEDIRIEKEEGSCPIDESNTWWDNDSGCGQIAWMDNSRATYDVTYTSKK